MFLLIPAYWSTKQVAEYYEVPVEWITRLLNRFKYKPSILEGGRGSRAFFGPTDTAVVEDWVKVRMAHEQFRERLRAFERKYGLKRVQ